MTIAQAGAYLRALRERQGLTQEELGDRIGVTRNTIGRMERGEESTFITTVMRAITVLNASPWSYYALVIDPEITLEQILARHAVIAGIAVYVQTLSRQRGLTSPGLLHREISFLTSNERKGIYSEFSLFIALTLLDAPLADLAQIIVATADHTARAQRLAEQRMNFDTHRQLETIRPVRNHESVPPLASALRHLAHIERNCQDQPLIHYEAILASTAINYFLSNFLGLVDFEALA